MREGVGAGDSFVAPDPHRRPNNQNHHTRENFLYVFKLTARLRLHAHFGAPGFAERRPTRGKQRTRRSVVEQLATVESVLAGEAIGPLDRVLLAQERFNLQAERAAMQETRLESLEAGFVAIAPSLIKRNGLTWNAWRAANVPARVLRRAGISPQL